MLSQQQSLLSAAREAKGWTQRVLAERAKVSQPSISKAEAGLVPLSLENRMSVARQLEVPPELIDHSATSTVTINCVHHRRRASTISATVRRRVEATALLTQYTVDQLTADVDLVAETTLPSLPIGRYAPETAARLTREEWRVPPGPVEHVVALLEAAGVMVVPRSLFAAGQDALSSRGSIVGRSNPLIVVTTGMAPDRQRFTLIHELGHLVLHSAPNDQQEQQANAFASEFLMPEDLLSKELRGLRTGDFERLFKLKERWGVSIAALVRRAHDLQIISDRQYRAFHVNLNQLGWRLSEPNQPDLEVPTTIRRLIELRLDSGETIEQLAGRAGMLPSPFIMIYRPDLVPQAPLRLQLGRDNP